MPLTKKSTTITSSNIPITGSAMHADNAPVIGATESVSALHTESKLGGTRKAGDKTNAPMTKDGYWDRKEARDIETGIRIRRSGVWQAALQSTGLLQLNTENTFESFMALVEKTANVGLNYVNKD